MRRSRRRTRAGRRALHFGDKRLAPPADEPPAYGCYVAPSAMTTSTRLWTLVIDFLGGTYVRQVRAATPHSAVLRWLGRRDLAIAAFTLARHRRAKAGALRDQPVPVSGPRDRTR